MFVWVKLTRLRKNMHMDLLNLSTLNKLNETKLWATEATGFSLTSVATNS